MEQEENPKSEDKKPEVKVGDLTPEKDAQGGGVARDNRKGNGPVLSQD